MGTPLGKLASKHDAEYIDLRFTDTRGKEQHLTIPANAIDSELHTTGKFFDGSSIAGWQAINESDMRLVPDLSHVTLDPFREATTLIVRCDVYDPRTDQLYDKCPRAVTKRAIDYLNQSRIADTANFGTEPEFFIFDSVRFANHAHHAFYHIDSEEGHWNSGTEAPHGNHGHRPQAKGGYFPVTPVDSGQDIRSKCCDILKDMDIIVETHHHEVASGGQGEIGTRFKDLVGKADEVQLLKYVVHNVAHAYGKTATFMPKPLFNDNGNGMHCHQSLQKGSVNLFQGDEYAGLSKLALHYIAGILRHAPALNAFTNATTNSYKRLVPGFEAPTILAHSACNRSAAIRIPYSDPKARRIEVRFPDPSGNPYLMLSAMLMAGLDGIENEWLPDEPMDQDLYLLNQADAAKLPSVASSLENALESLKQDHHFLLKGGVFNEALIESYIELKTEEIQTVNRATHPAEFALYYSL